MCFEKGQLEQHFMETRERIIEEMLRHVERFGRKRTRLIALAEDLNMSHANIYRHFKNKNEILDAIVLDWLQQADAVIEQELESGTSPKDAVKCIAVSLNRFLTRKLASEPAALEVFQHAFSDQADSVAAHLANLKMRIAQHVAAHLQETNASLDSLNVLMDLMTTTLENFLNPVLIHERQSNNDAEQLELLIDRLLP